MVAIQTCHLLTSGGSTTQVETSDHILDGKLIRQTTESFKCFLFALDIHRSVLQLIVEISLSHRTEVVALAGKLNVAQKKRLEIARAMATDPKLLLLDETMAGLTATERVEAVELIRKINKMGIAILTIEHNMDVVMRVSNRVVVLVSGRLLMVGSPEEVTSNPEVISAYLGGGSKDESE